MVEKLDRVKNNMLLQPRPNFLGFGAHPKSESKRFNIHKPGKTLFEANRNKGNSSVSMICPKLSEILSFVHCTNYQIQATVIQAPNMAGIFTPNDIIKLTGHKSVQSLSNYDPVIQGHQKASMAAAIAKSSHLKKR